MLYSQGLEYEWPEAKAQKMEMGEMSEKDEEKTPGFGKSIGNSEEAGAHGCA